MLVVNENDGQEFVSEFFDSGGNPTAPGTVEWSFRCQTTNRLLQDWTALPLQTSVETSGLTTYFVAGSIPGSLNAIQNERNSRELKQLQVVANRGQAGQYSDVFTYYVTNIKGR
jgi:hypothetical protein